MKRVRLQAPAKINLTLEALGKRDDGYHEIRSVMQTISLSDQIELTSADDVTLKVHAGPSFRRRPQETNLVFQAAELLRRQAGVRAGVHIELSKHIPVASGLGGGSTDAAATLRGLRSLWHVDISDDELASLGAELGSDVPFFLRGGTALASGRGEQIEPLPDLPEQHLLVAWPRPRVQDDKTARMYAALRPEHFSDGPRTQRLAERVRRGEPMRDEDVCNVFESVLSDAASDAARIFGSAAVHGLGSPHLCGSGPAVFFTGARTVDAAMLSALRACGLATTTTTHTITAAEALAMRETP